MSKDRPNMLRTPSQPGKPVRFWRLREIFEIWNGERSCRGQIKRLADWILENCPDEPGSTGVSESAVDVAIRLMGYGETMKELDRRRFLIVEGGTNELSRIR